MPSEHKHISNSRESSAVDAAPMGCKRKRHHDEESKSHKVSKKGKKEHTSSTTAAQAQHPTLRRYYSHVSSLQQYLQLRLETSASKARLRRLDALANHSTHASVLDGLRKTTEQDTQRNSDRLLGSLLSNTLVCHEQAPAPTKHRTLNDDYVAFSLQSLSTSESSINEGTASQNEVSAEVSVTRRYSSS